jgi:hypothetical protein
MSGLSFEVIRSMEGIFTWKALNADAAFVVV